MRPAAAVFVAVAFVATSIASYAAFSPDHAGTLVFWVLACGPSIAIGAVTALWAKREDLLREWLTPRWGDFTRGIVGAAVLFAAAWAFARWVAPVGSRREVWLVSLYSQLGDPHALQAHAAWVGAAFVVVALAEEIVWRAMVPQLLAERVGSRGAWVWAAALYAAAYLPTMWTLGEGAGPNPVLVVAALGGGLLWGAMARAFGSIVPAVLAHAGFDWAVVMIFPLWGGRFGM
jgi:membrane protease YdiL (CAAX protease family)